jgi:hypothetical protein
MLKNTSLSLKIQNYKSIFRISCFLRYNLIFWSHQYIYIFTASIINTLEKKTFSTFRFYVDCGSEPFQVTITQNSHRNGK